MRTPAPLLAVALLCVTPLAQAAANCTVKLAGDDRMQFDRSSLTVSASCPKVIIQLVHTGKLPAQVMGHNVVVSATGDVQALAMAGIKAGPADHYAPKGDARVLAVTPVIGGGATTSATLAGGKLKPGGDYTFFCSFPGHSAIMKGRLIVTR